MSNIFLRHTLIKYFYVTQDMFEDTIGIIRNSNLEKTDNTMAKKENKVQRTNKCQQNITKKTKD